MPASTRAARSRCQSSSAGCAPVRKTLHQSGNRGRVSTASSSAGALPSKSATAESRQAAVQLAADKPFHAFRNSLLFTRHLACHRSGQLPRNTCPHRCDRATVAHDYVEVGQPLCCSLKSASAGRSCLMPVSACFAANALTRIRAIRNTSTVDQSSPVTGLAVEGRKHTGKRKPLTTRLLWFRSGTPFEQEIAHVLVGPRLYRSVGKRPDEGITALNLAGSNKTHPRMCIACDADSLHEAFPRFPINAPK